jgi:hypothetical protein
VFSNPRRFLSVGARFTLPRHLTVVVCYTSFACRTCGIVVRYLILCSYVRVESVTLRSSKRPSALIKPTCGVDVVNCALEFTGRREPKFLPIYETRVHSQLQKDLGHTLVVYCTKNKLRSNALSTTAPTDGLHNHAASALGMVCRAKACS